jgi:hypothetical protein
VFVCVRVCVFVCVCVSVCACLYVVLWRSVTYLYKADGNSQPVKVKHKLARDQRSWVSEEKEWVWRRVEGCRENRREGRGERKGEEVRGR